MNSTQKRQYPYIQQKYVLEAVIQAIKQYYPIFKRERDYKKISLSFIEVFRTYQIDNRISSKMLKKINRLQSHNALFTKNMDDNYSVGHHNQGYNETYTFKILMKRIYKILDLKPLTVPIPIGDNSTDVFKFNKDVFKKNKLYEKFIDITITDDDVYIINDIKNFTKDNQGRIYSTFQRLPSKIKKLTDTPFELDISTAGQSLMLSIFHNANYKSYDSFLDITEPFEEIREYIFNKRNNRNMYISAMSKTGATNKEAKEFFTIPLYGGRVIHEFNKVQKNKSDSVYTFNQFCNRYHKEVSLLRDRIFEIYEHIEMLEAQDIEGSCIFDWENKIFNNQVIQAYYYAKDKLKNSEKKYFEYCNNSLNVFKPFSKNSIKNKVIFFMVEYYESIARRLAINVLKKEIPNLKVMENHDGIYTNIECSVFLYEINTELKNNDVYAKFTK